MKKYDSYKPSGIDWIGEIPSHWSVVRIKNVLLLLTDYDANGSFADIASNCNINEGEPYAWMVRATDLENKRYGIVEGNNYCDRSTYDYLSKSSLVADDILIAKRGDIGKSYLVPLCSDPMTLAPNTYLLKTIKTSINNHFFFHYLQSFSGKESLRLENKSTTLGALYKDDVKRISIPLPPLDEQESIAAWLDKKCGEIDAAIAKVDREIELIEELKQSEISRVVTRGLNPSVPLRPSGIDWIGEIPSHWEVKPLKHIVSYNDEVWPENTKEEVHINYVEIGDVSQTSGIHNFTEYEFGKAPSRARRIVRKDDVIISTVRTYLKAIAKVREDNLTVSTGFMVLRAKAISPSFLGYLILGNYFIQEIISKSVGVSYPAINSTEVINIKILVPTPFEQQEIADYLDKKCAEIDGLKAKLTKKRETLKELRQAIISEVVTGKRKVV